MYIIINKVTYTFFLVRKMRQKNSTAGSESSCGRHARVDIQGTLRSYLGLTRATFINTWGDCKATNSQQISSTIRNSFQFSVYILLKPAAKTFSTRQLSGCFDWNQCSTFSVMKNIGEKQIYIEDATNYQRRKVLFFQTGNSGESEALVWPPQTFNLFVASATCYFIVSEMVQPVL